MDGKPSRQNQNSHVLVTCLENGDSATLTRTLRSDTSEIASSIFVEFSSAVY